MREALFHRCSQALLAAALLGFAASRAAAEDVPPEAVLAELPFLSSPEPNRVVVDLAPEGSAKPLRLMLDTGAAEAVLTPRAARDLGVQVRRTKRDAYRRPTRLGRDLQFYVDVASSDTGSKTGWEYGVFGGQFLSEYVVEIDFPARRVRLIDPDRFSVPASVSAEGEAVIPVRMVSQRPGVEVQVNGATSLLMLDTGSPGTAVISGKLAQRAKLASAPVEGLSSGTVLGPMEVELGEARSLRIGPFEFDDLLLEVAPRGWYNIGFPDQSVIGCDLLALFVVRLDYPNQRLWLRRASQEPPRFNGADVAVYRSAGVFLLAKGDDGHFAWIVRPDGVAAQRGLRPGDWIAGKQSAQAIGAALREGKELTVVRQVNGIGVDTVLEAVAPPSAVSAPPNP
jgi:predicted aspartyl protease